MREGEGEEGEAGRQRRERGEVLWEEWAEGEGSGDRGGGVAEIHSQVVGR